MTGALKRAAAFCLRRAGLFRLHASRLERSRAILLVYHRVNDEGDPFFPALPRRTFAAQLDHAASHYRVEPLEEVAAWLAGGAPGPPRAALTIDDGHPDTLDVAFPELAAPGPARDALPLDGSSGDGRAALDRPRAVDGEARNGPRDRPALPRIGRASPSTGGTRGWRSSPACSGS